MRVSQRLSMRWCYSRSSVSLEHLAWYGHSHEEVVLLAQHAARHHIALMGACRSTSCRTLPVTDASAHSIADRGQSTVEAAALLPVLMLLLGMMAQPVCMLYTRMVMLHAAAEGARVALTAQNDNDVRQFVLRRLRAVPRASLFHVGGTDDWCITLNRSMDEGRVEVEVCGHVRPLPLLGTIAGFVGERDGTGVVLRVRVSEELRPGWVRDGYEAWQGVW